MPLRAHTSVVVGTHLEPDRNSFVKNSSPRLLGLPFTCMPIRYKNVFMYAICASDVPPILHIAIATICQTSNHLRLTSRQLPINRMDLNICFECPICALLVSKVLSIGGYSFIGSIQLSSISPSHSRLILSVAPFEQLE